MGYAASTNSKIHTPTAATPMIVVRQMTNRLSLRPHPSGRHDTSDNANDTTRITSIQDTKINVETNSRTLGLFAVMFVSSPYVRPTSILTRAPMRRRLIAAPSTLPTVTLRYVLLLRISNTSLCCAVYFVNNLNPLPAPNDTTLVRYEDCYRLNFSRILSYSEIVAPALM